MPRLTLLVTSPRLPAGLLTRDAWTALESASRVLAADLEDAVPAALLLAGIGVEQSPADARDLASSTGDVVWVGSPDGDPGLTEALAQELSALDEPPEVEVLVGSWDPPGARLLDAVAAMDVLRSPGGCPWDAEQTHTSLLPYLLEEAHETAEAIETGAQEHLVEELGDVLLQVLFHARLGEEAESAWDVDDVAAGLVAKLVRRHPHVFGDGTAATADEVETAWERIKAAEKADRPPDDLLAGIPSSLSTLLIAEKVLSRAARRGIDVPAADDLGGRLLALVQQARVEGVSADAALRAAVRRVATPPI